MDIESEESADSRRNRKCIRHKRRRRWIWEEKYAAAVRPVRISVR